MNQIVIEGNVVTSPKRIVVKINGQNTTLVTFVMVDRGNYLEKDSYSQNKNDPMYIEIHCNKDSFGSNVLDAITIGKHLWVSGVEHQKKYKENGNLKKSIYYIAADKLKFLNSIMEK